MAFRLYNIANPLSWITDKINSKLVKDTEPDTVDRSTGVYNRQVAGDRVLSAIEKAYNDYTGQTAIDQQFENNKALAKYQMDLQEELYNKYSSPEGIMRQLEAAGLNPNLAYGSATSGQSNVPSYNSPSAPLNLSYSDKVNKALSLITSVLGVKNLVYQTVANREVAEQSAIKTLNSKINLSTNTINNALLGFKVGYTPSLDISPFFRKSSLSRKRKGSVEVSFGDNLPGFIEYADALRSEVFNRAYNAYSNNYWMNGGGFFPKLGFVTSGDLGRNYYLNQSTRYQASQRQFNFDWDKDYKTMLKGAGIASPIIQTLIRLLGK